MPAVRLSRYEFSAVETDELGRTFLDVDPPPSKGVLLRGATPLVALEGETLWTLAWRAYRDARDPVEDFRPTSLFDAIAHANDVVDALAPLTTGKEYLIPSLEAIFTEFRVPPSGQR